MPLLLPSTHLFLVVKCEKAQRIIEKIDAINLDEVFRYSLSIPLSKIKHLMSFFVLEKMKNQLLEEKIKNNL